MTGPNQRAVPRPIAVKLAQVLGAIDAPPDDLGTNAVFAVARGPLADAGLTLVPSVAGPVEDVADLRVVRVPVSLTFIDGESGEQLALHWVGEGPLGGDSAVSTALTNAMRTFLRAQFLIHQAEHRLELREAPIDRQLYEDIVDAYKTAGHPERLFAAWMDSVSVPAGITIASRVGSMTRLAALQGIAYLKGLGVPVEPAQPEPDPAPEPQADATVAPERGGPVHGPKTEPEATIDGSPAHAAREATRRKAKA